MTCYHLTILTTMTCYSIIVNDCSAMTASAHFQAGSYRGLKFWFLLPFDLSDHDLIEAFLLHED